MRHGVHIELEGVVSFKVISPNSTATRRSARMGLFLRAIGGMQTGWGRWRSTARAVAHSKANRKTMSPT